MQEQKQDAPTIAYEPASSKRSSREVPPVKEENSPSPSKRQKMRPEVQVKEEIKKEKQTGAMKEEQQAPPGRYRRRRAKNHKQAE